MLGRGFDPRRLHFIVSVQVNSLQNAGFMRFILKTIFISMLYFSSLIQIVLIEIFNGTFTTVNVLFWCTRH